MGYTTQFDGIIQFDRELTVEEMNDLKQLAEEPYESDFFKKFAETKPDAYLQWYPTEDGTGLEWDGGEKFYKYVEWLEWLMQYFFEPKEIRCSGIVNWQGEEIGDVGKITVSNNVVTTEEIKIDTVECPHCGEVFARE